eukprot:SAG22_NODE_772_length_7314_cov_14.698545_4_plen_80_part_00
MNAPVIQNTLTRVPAVIPPHVYSVKPNDRSRAQLRDKNKRGEVGDLVVGAMSVIWLLERTNSLNEVIAESGAMSEIWLL